jgi:hypothetical protein
MHDFDELINQWRCKLRTELDDADAVDELEEHLRDLLAAECTNARSKEQVWARAIARLGKSQELAREFDKLHGRVWIDATLWWCMIVALAFVTAGLVMPMIAGLRQDRSQGLLITHVACISLGYVLSMAGGLAGAHYAGRAVAGNRCNAILTARLPNTVYWLAVLALPLTLAGVFLGAAWSSENRQAIWSWDLREVGALAALLAQASVLHASRVGWATRFRMGLACVASGIVLCAWFSPVLLQGTDYGIWAGIALGMIHLLAVLLMMTGVFVAARPALQRA